MPATLADIQRKYGDSVYPLYKDEMHEPYTENGGGYYGVVLYDELEDKIRCEKCGEWYKDLNSHLKHRHKMSVDEYRIDCGLYKKTPLCSVGRSTKAREIALNNADNISTFGRVKGKWTKKVRSKLSKSQKSYGLNSVQYKNTKSLCPAQIHARLVVLSQILKKPISKLDSGDLSKYDKKLYKHLGTDKLKSYDIDSAFISRRGITDIEIIAILREYVCKNRSIPKSKQLRNKNGLPGEGTVIRTFGSWSRAKMMAGLDQLLAEVKGV